MSDKPELQKKISRWLAEQGYPLEMEAAKAFRSCGFETTQSAYYVDTESGDPRETDVVASQCVNAAGVLIRLSVVVECKRSDDRPWLLFSTGRRQLPDHTCVAQRASSFAGEQALLALMKHPTIRESPLFKEGDNSGYSLTQALGKDNNDVAYKALMSVSSATSSMAIFSDHFNLEQGRVVKVKENYAHVLFPVVLISGSLWRCTLNEGTHEIDVAEIGCGTLVWKNKLLRHPHTLVHIVTSEHLASFAEDAAETWRQLKEASEGSANADIAAIPKMFVEKRKARVVTSIPI